MQPFRIFRFIVILLFLLGIRVSADEVIRVMAANITSGNLQSYDPGEGNRIFQGLDPDIVMVQETNVGTGTNKNKPATYRAWVDANFGSSFFYFVEPVGNIPNGIVSRYPIIEAGEWDDSTMTDRDYVWARIDIPGDKDFWAVSVHISSGGGASQRNEEAGEIKSYIQTHVPAGDYLAIGGDFNTTSRTEACITTLSSVVVTTGPYPVDQAGDGDTNNGTTRSNPYDWVMADADLNALKTPLVIGSNTFPSGLVFDSRVYSPLSEVAPILVTDSDRFYPGGAATNMQHMAVMRAFLIPTPPANAAPVIASAAKTSSFETAPDLYQIVRAASTGISVAATDDAGESSLKYTWSKTSGSAGSVSFSVNGTNAAKNCSATFQAAGDYTLAVTVQDVPGLSVTSSVNVRVVQTAGSLTLNPPTASLAVNATQAFTATLLDQFNQAMAGSFNWSSSGGGGVNASGVFTATTAGGPYVVTASSGGFSDTSSVTVTRAAAAVTLANLSQTYDGQPKPVTATTTPTVQGISIQYAGSSTPPTNAGSYAVVATITDPNYQGSSSGTLVVQKATTVLQLSGLATTYDGSPKPVTATGTPPVQSVTILYGGSATAPTNADSYSVSAVSTDGNYTGAISGTLVIQKATATLELAGLNPTYDGNPKPVTVTTTPSGLPVTIHYDGSPTPPVNSGSYAITTLVTADNYQGASSATLIIAPDEWAYWKNTYFTEPEQTAGLAADPADPDADGLSNLAEYALGANPRQFTAPLPGVLDTVGISIIFTRPANLPGIHYFAEATGDFTTWSPVALELLNSGPVETLRARDPFPAEPLPPRFLRLRFERD